jgi:hypothetical protein
MQPALLPAPNFTPSMVSAATRCAEARTTAPLPGQAARRSSQPGLLLCQMVEIDRCPAGAGKKKPQSGARFLTPWAVRVPKAPAFNWKPIPGHLEGMGHPLPRTHCAL